MGIVATGLFTITDVSDGLNATLTLDAAIIPTGSDGTGGDFSGAVSTFGVRIGTFDDTENWLVSATPSAGVTGSLVGTTYTVTALSVDSGYVDFTASRPGYTSLTKRFTVAKQKSGLAAPVLNISASPSGFTFLDDVAEPSVQVITVTASKQRTTEPIYFFASNGTALETNFALLSGMGATMGMPLSGDGEVCYVTLDNLMGAEMVYITAVCGELTQVIALGRENAYTGADGADGAAGQRGTITTAYAIGGTSWDDPTAVAAIAAAGGVAPIPGDVVTLHNNGASFSQTRVYTTGLTWAILAAFFGGDVLVDGTVVAQKIATNAITTDKIAANAITSAKLTAGELITLTAQIKDGIINNAKIADLSAAKLTAGTALANDITVNGTALGTMQSQAADPAARINAHTTKIDPGKVTISGTTTLADWQKGGDLTKIDGGAISANTISANKLEIGSRNITLTGIQWEHNAPSANSVSWTAGTVSYTNDAGSKVSVAITAGNAAWTTGTLFVYWVKDATTFTTTTSLATAVGSDRIVLATYEGGVALNADWGRTVIDGSNIKTGTITADRIAAGTITGDRIAGTTITGSNIAGGTITATQMAANSITATQIEANAVTSSKINVSSLSSITATIGLLRTATSGERLEIHSDRIVVYDSSNTIRVRIGNL